MKRTIVLVAVLAVFCTSALPQEKEKKPFTLRGVLLEATPDDPQEAGLVCAGEQRRRGTDGRASVVER